MHPLAWLLSPSWRAGQRSGSWEARRGSLGMELCSEERATGGTWSLADGPGGHHQGLNVQSHSRLPHTPANLYVKWVSNSPSKSLLDARHCSRRRPTHRDPCPPAACTLIHQFSKCGLWNPKRALQEAFRGPRRPKTSSQKRSDIVCFFCVDVHREGRSSDG